MACVCLVHAGDSGWAERLGAAVELTRPGRQKLTTEAAQLCNCRVLGEGSSLGSSSRLTRHAAANNQHLGGGHAARCSDLAGEEALKVLRRLHDSPARAG